MHPITRRNMIRALEREAVAAARLTAYALQADRDHDSDSARTLRAIAEMDLEHAADMVQRLGWVGSLRENVLASVIGDATTQGLNYVTLAGEARKVGDHQAAELFRRLTTDETEAAFGLLALASGHSAAGQDLVAGRSPDQLDEPQARLVDTPRLVAGTAPAA